MKKIMTVALSAMMLATAMTGCSEKIDPKKDYERITKNKEMTVGITIFAPMNYYDDNNKLIGFDTELSEAVGEKLGVDIKFKEINWDSKEVELNSGNIDCIWNGMCITEERKENMSISAPYLNNTQAMVMKSDVADKYSKDASGKVVVAEQGSTGEGKITGDIVDDASVVVSAKEFFKDSDYKAVDSMAKALMEVKSGTADIALVDSVCAYGMVGEGTDYPELVVNIDNEFGAQQYGIAFRKGSNLTEKVNKAIEELQEDGTVAALAEKYNLTDMLITK